MTRSQNLIQPAYDTIDLDEYRLQCQVVYSRRKTIQLVLKSADFLVIKAPLNIEPGVLAQLVTKRRKWLLKHIASLKACPYAEKPRFEDGSTHFFLGRPYSLCLQIASAKRFSRSQDRFMLSVPANNTAVAEELLYKFYASEAKQYFNQRLDDLWPAFRDRLAVIDPAGNWRTRPRPTLTVRRMKSRFGSMTANNKMTLNTELIRVAPRYIDYVILHELCHLKHMNHSKAYYALLETILPPWHTLKQELLRLLPLR